MTFKRSDVYWRPFFKADPNICFAGESPLYIAYFHGHAEIVELLLNNKSVPNICWVGEYPYYIASRHGHAEMVKLLLNNKADPNKCWVGDSPLYIASRHGCTGFIIQQQFDNLYMTVTRSDV
jgi:ankyrin repeat protein